MTRKPSPHGPAPDLATVRADDLLLDALGHGDPAPADDDLAAMLGAWRAELSDVTDESDVTEEEDDLAPVRRRRLRSGTYRLILAGAVVVAAAGGVGVAAAATGTPGSPLWPITQVVNPDRANVLQAQDALDQARQAITAGRYADAGRLLDTAQGLISRVPAGKDAQRLRADLATLRAALPTSTPGTAPSGTSPAAPPANGTRAPGAVTPTPGPGGGATPGGGAQGGGQPSASPSATGAGGLPLPLPTGILHSLLPSLIP
jgi:Anti-sigma-D factor RsdA to sigma factor binding region